MTTIAEVAVRFRGDVGALLSDARTQGGQAGTRAGESFAESFNEASKRLIKGFIGAELILKTVDILKESVKAAREDQLVTDQLTAAIRANAKARADDTEQIERQTKAAAEFGFTDNETKQSLIGLVAATHDLGEAIRVQNVAMDLARFKHISLQEASDALVKVEGGRFRLLAGLGIQLDAHATKEQALTAVERVAAGQRETFAATDEGAAKRRDAAYDKLLETIGSKLTPILRDLANFETNVLIPAGTALADNLDKFAPILEGLAAALTIKVVGGFGAARLAALGFGSGLTTTAEVAVADGAVIEGTARGAAGAWRTAIGVILILPEVMHLVGDAYESVRKTVFGSNPVIEQWNTVLKGSTDGSQAQTDALGVLTGANKQLNDAVGAGTDATGANTDATAAGTNAVNESVFAYGQYNGVLAGAEAAANRGATAQDRLALGVAGAGDAAAVAARQFATLAAAEAGFRRGTRTAADAGLVGPSGLDFTPGAGGPGGTTSADYYLTQLDTQIADRLAAAQRARTGRHRGGGSRVSQAAKDDAATIRADMTTAYNAAKSAGDAFYDKMHQRILDHIAKVHQQASDEIATERTKVNAWLAEEQRKNAAPVTAAEQALATLQHQRQMRNLQESFDAALLTGDPAQIRAAREAQEEARMQERIDALKADQVKADAIATQTAKNEQLALDARQKAADDKAKTDANAENDEAPKRKKRFDDALADWYRHLTAVKGHHKDAIKELNDLWTKFGLDAKDHGKKFGTELAAGLKSEMKAVESAAESLAAAVAKYIKTGSPAQAGIFHDDPPEKMGARVTRQWLEGAVQVLAQSGSQIDNAVRAGPGSALGGQRSQRGQNGQGSPAGYDPAKWAYYVANGGAASGLTYQEWLAAISAGTQPNEFGMTPGMYSAQATTYRDPLTQVDRTSGQSYSGIGPQGGGAPTINVEVNNPTAEPASTSAKRELQLLAATGILG